MDGPMYAVDATGWTVCSHMKSGCSGSKISTW